MPHPQLTHQPHHQGQQSYLSAEEFEGGESADQGESVRGEAGEGVEKCQLGARLDNGGLQEVEEEVEHWRGLRTHTHTHKVTSCGDVYGSDQPKS